MSVYHRILVPLDGSDTAERGLQEAIGLASAHQATLHLLHVVDDFRPLYDTVSIRAYQDCVRRMRRDGECVLQQASHAAAAAGVATQATLREVTRQSVAEAIVDEANQSACGLIVMGTHGRRGMARLAMGSQAEGVVRASPVPVLLVRRADAHA